MKSYIDFYIRIYSNITLKSNTPICRLLMVHVIQVEMHFSSIKNRFPHHLCSCSYVTSSQPLSGG